MDSHVVYRGDGYEHWQNVSRSLEDLDAALFRHLSDLSPRAREGLKPVDFERTATPSSVIFTLKHPRLGGELGKIELRRRADKLTALGTAKDPRPERQVPTGREEADMIAGVEDGRPEAIDEAYMKVRERERKLRRELGRYFDIIVHQLFQKQCRHDPILREALDATVVGAPAGDTVDKSVDDEDKAELPRWFPKTEKTQQRWQKVYSLIKRKRREYDQLYMDGEIDDPKVSNEELRDAIAAEGIWNGKPSVSTLCRITKAGDELGLLR